jgi:hypothetical protein
MDDGWEGLGWATAGVVALLIALGRGWLLTPQHLEQWRSRYEDMKRDRDYWRNQARAGQQQADDALSIRYDEITGAKSEETDDV